MLEDLIKSYRLRSVSFADLLSDGEAEQLFSHAQSREFKKGQVLFTEGSRSKGVYIVRKGRIKVHNTSDNGRLSVAYIYGKRDFFGYRPLICDEPHPVTATAIEHSVVTFVPRKSFLALLDHSATLARRLLRCMASEFTVWIHKIAVFTQLSVRKRVALALLILSDSRQPAGDKRSFSMSREDLAGYVGTAKESLVRTLKIFKDLGAIETKGRQVSILNTHLLMDELSPASG